MLSTRERLTGYSKRRIMTDDGWKYFCADCNDFHPKSWFYLDQKKPFGVFPSCSRNKGAGTTKKSEKSDVLTKHLKMQPISEDDIRIVLGFLTHLGYDVDKGVHQQWMEKKQSQGLL